jgi:hypothetical protein
MIRVVCAISAALLFVTPLLGKVPANHRWQIGREAEVDDGVYAKLLYEANGWRVWRFEQKIGISCYLTKPATGGRAAVPLGVSTYLYGSTPRLSIYLSQGERRINLDTYKVEDSPDELWSIEGFHGGATVQYRLIGQRFYTPAQRSKIPPMPSGSRVEVAVQSWEYDKIKVGLVDERGVIDLTGLDAARIALRQCRPVTS